MPNLFDSRGLDAHHHAAGFVLKNAANDLITTENPSVADFRGSAACRTPSLEPDAEASSHHLPSALQLSLSA